MEGMATVTKCLHLSSTSGATTPSPLTPSMLPCSHLPCGISVGEKVCVSGCDCGLPHIDEKVGCGDSNWGANMGSDRQALEMVRNKQ